MFILDAAVTEDEAYEALVRDYCDGDNDYADQIMCGADFGFKSELRVADARAEVFAKEFFEPKNFAEFYNDGDLTGYWEYVSDEANSYIAHETINKIIEQYPTRRAA